MSLPSSRLAPAIQNKILQQVSPDFPEDPARNITVSDVFDLIVKGYSFDDIQDQQPEISEDAVTSALSIISVKHPDIYLQITDDTPYTAFNALLDENITWKSIDPLNRIFSHVTHTRYVGLNGCGSSDADGDKRLWQWAINNEIDAIITHDCANRDPDTDLTKIATSYAIKILDRMDEHQTESVTMEKLPVIIHLENEVSAYKDIKALFERHADTIKTYLEDRNSPYIRVTDTGVRSSPTYRELYEKVKNHNDRHDYAHRTKTEKMVDKWTKKILRNRREKDTQKNENVDDLKELRADLRQKAIRLNLV